MSGKGLFLKLMNEDAPLFITSGGTRAYLAIVIRNRAETEYEPILIALVETPYSFVIPSEAIANRHSWKK